MIDGCLKGSPTCICMGVGSPGHQEVGFSVQRRDPNRVWSVPDPCACLRGGLPPCLHPQIFTRMGQCYTFNSGAHGAELLTTPKGGAGNGLEIMLDVQQEEYLPVWKDMGKGHTRWGLPITWVRSTCTRTGNSDWVQKPRGSWHGSTHL